VKIISISPLPSHMYSLPSNILNDTFITRNKASLTCHDHPKSIVYNRVHTFGVAHSLNSDKCKIFIFDFSLSSPLTELQIIPQIQWIYLHKYFLNYIISSVTASYITSETVASWIAFLSWPMPVCIPSQQLCSINTHGAVH
jgi:hypothetical protein